MYEILGHLAFGVLVPADPDPLALYGLIAYGSSWELQMQLAHQDCAISTFCRNPLHPGPCKGWKRHLGLVSPGALHALEKARYDALEAKRQDKVKALKEAGKVVPKHLSVPIVYDPAKNKWLQDAEHDKITPGLGIPTKGLTDQAAKDTLDKIPTKADVNAKVAAKQAAEAVKPHEKPISTTLKQAGLKHGDKVFFHGSQHTWVDGDHSKGTLVTVSKSPKSYTLTDENGKYIHSGGHATKVMLSPAPGKTFPQHEAAASILKKHEASGPIKVTEMQEVSDKDRAGDNAAHAGKSVSESEPEHVKVLKSILHGGAPALGSIGEAFKKIKPEEVQKHFTPKEQDSLKAAIAVTAEHGSSEIKKAAQQAQINLGHVAPPAPAEKLAADISPAAKLASDHAHGFASATDTKKLEALDQLPADDYAQLPANTKHLINASLNKMHTKFLAQSKKDKVAAVKAKFAVAHGGGAGEGGSGLGHEVTPAAKAVDLDHAVKVIYKHFLLGGIGDDKASAKARAMHALLQATEHHSGPKGVKDVLHTTAKSNADKILYEHNVKTTDKEPMKAALVSEMMKQFGGDDHDPVKHPFLQAAGEDGPDESLHLEKALDKALNKKVPATAVPIVHAAKPAELDGHAKQKVMSAYKSLPHTQLSDATSGLYDKVHATQVAMSQDPDVGPITLRQTLQAIDEKHSETLGVSNAGLLEKKVSDWLKTPEGKQHVLDNPMPDKDLVSKLSGTADPTLPALAPGEKVKTLGGPGKLKNKSSTDFPGYTSEEGADEMAAYKKSTGTELTQEQKDAIYAYTTGSGPVNNYLRGTDKDGTSTPTKVMAQHLQNAMYPTQKDQAFSRGVGLNAMKSLAGFSEDDDPSLLVGRTISDPAFLSTSFAGSGGNDAFLNNGLGQVQFHIEAPKGTMGIAVNPHGSPSFYHENEFLMAAGTKLHILSAEKINGVLQIRARVVS